MEEGEGGREHGAEITENNKKTQKEKMKMTGNTKELTNFGTATVRKQLRPNVRSNMQIGCRCSFQSFVMQ